MGLGGIIVLVLLAAIVAYILVTEKTFRKKPPSDDLFASLPKVGVTLAKAPQDMTERLTPKWQADLCQKLQDEGYVLIGDHINRVNAWIAGEQMRINRIGIRSVKNFQSGTSITNKKQVFVQPQTVRAGHRIFCVTLSSHQVSPSCDLSAALDLETVRILKTGMDTLFTLGE